MAGGLANRDFKIWGDGTDTHLVLMDVASKGLSGNDAQAALEAVGITTNKNPTPVDPASPNLWTGVRLGSAAGTTRGFCVGTFEIIAALIADSLENVSNESARAKTVAAVNTICDTFPIYP